MKYANYYLIAGVLAVLSQSPSALADPTKDAHEAVVNQGKALDKEWEVLMKKMDENDQKASANGFSKYADITPLEQEKAKFEGASLRGERETLRRKTEELLKGYPAKVRAVFGYLKSKEAKGTLMPGEKVWMETPEKQTHYLGRFEEEAMKIRNSVRTAYQAKPAAVATQPTAESVAADAASRKPFMTTFDPDNKVKTLPEMEARLKAAQSVKEMQFWDSKIAAAKAAGAK